MYVEIGAHAEDLCTEDYEILISSPLQILQDGFLLGLGLSKQNLGTLFVSRSACDPTSFGHPQNSLSAIGFCGLLELKPPKTNKNLIDTVR